MQPKSGLGYHLPGFAPPTLLFSGNLHNFTDFKKYQKYRRMKTVDAQHGVTMVTMLQLIYY